MPKEFNLFEQDALISPEDVANTHAESIEQPAHETSAPMPVAKAESREKNAPREKAELSEQKNIVHQHAKRIIEALLFASNEPLTFNKIREILDSFTPCKPSIIRELIVELQQDYISQQRAFRLEEIANGYILRSCEEYGAYIELLHRDKRSEKLSQASAEVLAIIAYRQPITRPQIEVIRGVDSSGVIQNLLEKEFIEAVGKADAPGRPTLYGITKDFLKHFGLKDVAELPKIPTQPTSPK